MAAVVRCALEGRLSAAAECSLEHPRGGLGGRQSGRGKQHFRVKTRKKTKRGSEWTTARSPVPEVTNNHPDKRDPRWRNEGPHARATATIFSSQHDTNEQNLADRPDEENHADAPLTSAGAGRRLLLRLGPDPLGAAPGCPPDARTGRRCHGGRVVLLWLSRPRRRRLLLAVKQVRHNAGNPNCAVASAAPFGLRVNGGALKGGRYLRGMVIILLIFPITFNQPKNPTISRVWFDLVWFGCGNSAHL